MGLIADILPSLLKDIAYGPAVSPGLLASQSVVIKRRTGVTFVPSTAGESGTPVVDTETLSAMAPWPYRETGVAEDVKGGDMLTSVTGRDANFTFAPEAGMLLSGIENRTWIIVQVDHDLDGDEYLLRIRGAG